MRGSANTRRPFGIFLVVAVAVAAADQAAKHVALSALRPHEPVPLLGDWVRLTLTHNKASAFGLLPAGPALLAAMVVFCVALLAYAFVAGGLRRHPERAVPLALVFGGAVGNLLDRIRTAGVYDFIDLRVWPVFNLADIAITAGCALLAIQLVRRH